MNETGKHWHFWKFDLELDRGKLSLRKDAGGYWRVLWRIPWPIR